MHSRCCWPPESASAESFSRSLTSSQSAARAQALLDASCELLRPRAMPLMPQAVGDVVEDRLRKRVRLLEDHADAAPQLHDVDVAAVDVAAVDADRALDPRAGNDVVHPVERSAGTCYLPQPDGPMNAVTRFALDLERDVLRAPACARRRRSSCSTPILTRPVRRRLVGIAGGPRAAAATESAGARRTRRRSIHQSSRHRACILRAAGSPTAPGASRARTISDQHERAGPRLAVPVLVRARWRR